MAIEFGTFTDPRDGEVYKTIKTGGKEWLAENLRFKCKDSISVNGDEANDKKYGRLYSGRIMSTIVPEGWLVPAYKEFVQFAEALGSKKDIDLASTEGWCHGNNRLWKRESDFKEPTGYSDFDLMSVRPFRPYKAPKAAKPAAKKCAGKSKAAKE